MKRILIPIDGSEASKHAVAQAIEIMGHIETKISLLMVQPDLPLIESSGKPSPKLCMPTLDEFQALFGDKADHVETICESGRVVEKIVSIAEEGNYDLLIMGSTGINHPLERFFVGSVTDGVLKKAHIPILVVH